MTSLTFTSDNLNGQPLSYSVLLYRGEAGLFYPRLLSLSLLKLDHRVWKYYNSSMLGVSHD